MEKPELKDSVCCNLRSVTQSIKGGVPLNRLERDYRDLIGSSIPYRDLGYNSLESFIRAIPSVISLTKGRDGYLMAEAVADSSTAHIASLISRQKETSKAKASKRFSSRRGGYAPKHAYRGERNSYGSYSAAKSSGRSYKHDYKASQGYHSRPQNKTSPLNFKMEIKNTNHIPVDKTPALTTKKPLPAPSTTRQPSPPAADKPKSKAPFMVRGYEIAPRFQRLLQRKVEAREQEQRSSQESTSSSNSHTARSSVTPPRTPSPNPNPYAFTATSIASAHSSSSRTSPTDDIFFPPPSEPLAPTQMSYSPVKVGSNGFASARPRSPLQLRARRLNAKTLSQQLESAQSAKEYVEIYARINNLACSYSTNTIGQKKPNKGYVTVLTLGDHKHLSYPDVSKTKLEAEEIAANKAVNKIKESLGNGVPTRRVVICDDDNLKIRICL